MSERYVTYLELANGAAARRDYLSAMQYGLWAAAAPRDAASLRCDAELLLAVISLELGDPVGALAYAVGAHLRACQARDDVRAEQAAAMAGMVVAQHPYLVDQPDCSQIH